MRKKMRVFVWAWDCLKNPFEVHVEEKGIVKAKIRAKAVYLDGKDISERVKKATKSPRFNVSKIEYVDDIAYLWR